MRDRFHEQLQQLSEALITMAPCARRPSPTRPSPISPGTGGWGSGPDSWSSRSTSSSGTSRAYVCSFCCGSSRWPVTLRTISAAMRMISDMERIGDQAADIAEIARDVQAGKLADETPMGDMARTAISMVTDSVDAFVRQDLDLAHQVIARWTRWTACS